MNIKTKYNLGDLVIINGFRCEVDRICCDVAKYLPTGDTEVHVEVYGKRKITTKDGRVITLGDGAHEQDVEPVKVKGNVSIREATEAINKAAISNLKPDEDDLYMENLADLSIKMVEISHLADKAYAEEDLRDLDRHLSSMCRNWKAAWEKETNPVVKERNYGIWDGLSMATSELEILITNLGDHTRELRRKMRGQDEEAKT